MTGRLISRSPKSANRTRRRHCKNPKCGRPLGSTYDLCHDCGGTSIRADRQTGRPSVVPFLPGVTAALGELFDRRGGGPG